MKECIYCGKEFDGIYFCEKCKKEIIETQRITTGNVISDWVASAYWYLEMNNGGYWKNYGDYPEEENDKQFIRAIDYIRFDEYRKSIGADHETFAMNAKNLNEMEEWYLELARKEMNK